MRNILLIPEFSAYGGTRTYCLMLLRFYTSQPYQVTVAMPLSQMDDEFASLMSRCGYLFQAIPERSRSFGRIFHRFPFSILYDIIILRRLIMTLQPDLTVLSVGSPGLFLGVLVLTRRAIYILHSYPLGRSLGPIRKLFSMMLLQRRRVLVTVSEYAKEETVKCWMTRKYMKSVRVIASSAGNVLPNDEMCKCRVDNRDTQRVLTLGHVITYKNPLLWIQVARLVIDRLPEKDIEFIWAGDGELLASCKEIAERNGLGRIKFVGYHKNIDSLYAGSTVYFQPSITESQGLSVIDAMRRGIPCVVSDAGGLPESIINNVTGFVVRTNDIEAMTEKLIALLNNPSLVHQMGKASVRHYQDKFSYSAWSDKMQRLHEELLKQMPQERSDA